MDIPTIINHNYYILRSTKTNRTWICEAKRFDDKNSKLYYYYGTYELGSDEHKKNYYLSDSYYSILPAENDEVRLATMEEIDILMDVLEKNGIVTTLQKAKDKAKAPDLKMKNVLAELLEHIKTASKDELEREFKEIESEGWTNVGPTVEEFMTFYECVNKKPVYPKTYEECAKIMNCPIDGPSGWLFNFDANIKDTYYRKIDILMGKFIRLRICRDAYWKIAGEQKGLGKPWEPKSTEMSHAIVCRDDGDFLLHRRTRTILIFPTEEMRDAFYENFKDLIEQCKELL